MAVSYLSVGVAVSLFLFARTSYLIRWGVVLQNKIINSFQDIKPDVSGKAF